MLPLILAAVLSFDQMLQEFDDFSVKAELEVRHPITQEMVTKSFPHLDKGTLGIHVTNRYQMEYWGGRVRNFEDLEEGGHPKLSRLDPAEMQEWSERPCLIDKAGAQEIAVRLFRRLGFDEKQFDLDEVHRFSWQPSEEAPEHVLWLPLFWVKWWRKGVDRNDQSAPYVNMNISATTKRLVYYSDTTRDDDPLRDLLEGFTRLSPEHAVKGAKDASASLAKIVAPVDSFFNAAGIKPKAGWRKRIQATELPACSIVQVQDRYLLKLRGGSVREFGDSERSFYLAMLEERSTILSNWVDAPTVITETQAVQIATHLLTRLGFDKQAFNPAEVKLAHPELSREDPDHPGKMVPLQTSYAVQWVGKRPASARSGRPDVVEMEISGANSNLLHYWYSPNTFHF